MEIYKVFRTDYVAYDEYDGAIVVAKDEQHARELVAKAMPYGWADVVDDENISVELVDTSEEGVVLASYNAG